MTNPIKSQTKAVVTLSISVTRNAGTWGGTATLDEVRRVSGAEKIRAIEQAFDAAGLEYVHQKDAVVGVLTWEPRP